MKPLPAAERVHIGPYRLLGELGQGVMGRVLLAYRPRHRLVALRRFHPWLLADAELMRRMRAEIRQALEVSGAHVVPVVDADPDAEEPWLASVFVLGLTLAEVIAAGVRLPKDAALRLLIDLSRGLVSLRAAGLAHRDLKPSNVVLVPNGAMLMDYGLVRAADLAAVEDAERTRDAGRSSAARPYRTDRLEPGQRAWVRPPPGRRDPLRGSWRLASPGYLAPELVYGQHSGPAADAFSLGSVVAAAVTGHGPFDDPDTFQTLVNVATREPLLSGLRGRPRALVYDLLDKDPLRRLSPELLLASTREPEPSQRPWPEAVEALAEARREAVAEIWDRPLRHLTVPGRPVSRAVEAGVPSGGVVPVAARRPVPASMGGRLADVVFGLLGVVSSLTILAHLLWPG